MNVAEVFVPAISPASFEDWNRNEYYNSDEDYVVALGEAMRTEYQAIIDAGFLLQIDDPRLVTYYILHPDGERRGLPQMGASCASRRSIMRCAAFRPRKSAITPATASTWARASTTWS